MKKVLYLLAGAVIWSLLSTTGSSAASLSDFRAGNIISNEMMSNKVTMSEVQIQNFLKSKVVCNSTGGGYINQLTISPDGRTASLPGYSATWNIKNGRFVCMADDTFNGETAAHIIWQAAQDYNINPQVLIVLLQKESGLITDDFPNSIQYRSATGYGCPDTAPCDAQYYGLKNQVRRAAGLFNEVLTGGWTNYPLGNNTVLYNPDRSCGSSVVNIQNLATSALYRYTPYQPNPATLAAPWGSTVSCGAYGNSNFFMYFTTWFGSTTYNGKAVRSDTNGSGVYLIENGIKRAFDSVDALYSHNYSWDKVLTVSSTTIASIPTGPALGINIDAYTGRLLKSNAPNSGIYLVESFVRRPFESAAAFNSYGYDWGKIITVSDAVMADIPIGPPIGIR